MNVTIKARTGKCLQPVTIGGIDNQILELKAVHIRMKIFLYFYYIKKKK